jgi:hypothetical protein
MLQLLVRGKEADAKQGLKVETSVGLKLLLPQRQNESGNVVKTNNVHLHLHLHLHPVVVLVHPEALSDLH